MKHNAMQWITWLGGRWRSQLAASRNVNCRTHEHRHIERILQIVTLLQSIPGSGSVSKTSSLIWFYLDYYDLLKFQIQMKDWAFPGDKCFPSGFKIMFFWSVMAFPKILILFFHCAKKIQVFEGGCNLTLDWIFFHSTRNFATEDVLYFKKKIVIWFVSYFFIYCACIKLK